MPVFKRQALVLCALTALALGVIFAFWPNEPTGIPLAPVPTAEKAAFAPQNPTTSGQNPLPLDTRPAPKTEPPKLTAGEKIIVYVSGAVQRPGVYELDGGKRVEDALKAAGGATGQADLEKINLAARLNDGEQIAVTCRPDIVPPYYAPQSPTAASQTDQVQRGSKADNRAIVNINSATERELENLVGIGPALAARIADYRRQHGNFRTIEEIMNVKGIGPAKFERMKGQLVL